MILATVMGTVTSSDKNTELGEYKLLVVQPLTIDGEPVRGREPANRI